MQINEFCEVDKEKITFDYQEIVRNIEKVFSDKFVTDKEASLILVDISKIHEINLQFRHIDRPTDVISFEESEEEGYLGEIFICIDKVYEQANNYCHSNEREFAFLLCHGLLHLLGYDHLTKEDEEEMFKKQDEILDLTIYRRN